MPRRAARTKKKFGPEQLASRPRTGEWIVGLCGFMGRAGVEEGGGKGAAGRAELGFQLGFGPLPNRN
jgi:hypothetical protein